MGLVEALVARPVVELLLLLAEWGSVARYNISRGKGTACQLQKVY